MDDELEMLTRACEPKAAKIPNGPSVIVVESGEAMYDPKTNDDTKSKTLYRKALLKCKKMAWKSDATKFKVLSLDGRPAIKVTIRKDFKSGQFYIDYGKANVTVTITKSGDSFRIVRGTAAGQCKDKDSYDTRNDTPSIDCMFDPDTNELLYSNTTASKRQIRTLLDTNKAATIQLREVFPPSVFSRKVLEEEVEKDAFGGSYGGRLLVPWYDYGKLDKPTLIHKVGEIVRFFLNAKEEDVIVVRCSAGEGRSGLAMIIGYLAFNRDADIFTVKAWFESVHDAPDEAWGMYTNAPQGSPSVRAVIREVLATLPASFTDLSIAPPTTI